jgi:hypothetical protein
MYTYDNFIIIYLKVRVQEVVAHSSEPRLMTKIIS